MKDAEAETVELSERREFLRNAVAASAALSGATFLNACATGASGAAAATNAARPSSSPMASNTQAPQWDMSWQQKLGKYKTVYDGTDPQIGSPLATVALTITGYKAAYGDRAKDFTPVLVLRHNAAYVALNHAMWKRTHVSARLKPKELGEKYADQNPFRMPAVVSCH